MKHCSSCGELVNKSVPEGDNRHRWVCSNCDVVHYQNPKIVVGCVPEHRGKILLCKRAIQPRYGFWTVPAGFMELGETMADGAARETLEEACANVDIGHLFACVDVVQAGQVHVFFTAKMLGDFGVGEETLEAELYAPNDIPWDEIAFPSGYFALRKYLEDAGENNGTHMHSVQKTQREKK